MSRKPEEKKPLKEQNQIFRDITWLPSIANTLNIIAQNTRNQIASLERSFEQPYLLDDQIVAQTVVSYKQALEEYIPIKDQLNHWLEQDLDSDQRDEVERLVELNEVVRARNERIIDLCGQIKEGSIDRIMEKDDYQLGLDALTGKLSFQPPTSSDDRYQVARKIDEFVTETLAAGGSDDDIVNDPQMPAHALQLQSIISEAKPGEMDALAELLPGFGYFAKLLEVLVEMFKEFKGM